MKNTRKIFFLGSLLAAVSLLAQSPTAVQKGGAAGANNITADLSVATSRTLRIAPGGTFDIDGIFNGTPTGGTLDLSALTLTLPVLSGYQPINANLTALSGLTGAANKLPYFTGSGAMALADYTPTGFGLTLSANATVGGTHSGTSSGTNTGDQNLFGSIVVSGQTTVTANSNPTALTLVAGSNITLTTDNTAKTVTVTAANSGQVTSVFSRIGDVVALGADYASFYGQLDAENVWTRANTFAGSFIFPPVDITVTANAGTIDVTKVRSVATNGANLTLTPSAAGTNGQQIGIMVVNSNPSASFTVTGAGTASAISYTAAANSGTLTYWQSNGSAWTLVGGAPTIFDLTTVSIASADFVSFWDSSAGIMAKAAISGTGSLAATTSPTFITPTLGAATATSLNKWTFTAPTTAATLTAGGDSLTYTLPSSTQTIVGRTSSDTLTNKIVDFGSSLASDDTYVGETISGLNNSGGVTQWQAVYMNSSSQWVIADANGTGTYPARGLAVATATTGNAVTVVIRGIVRNDGWSAWTVGAPVYLSGTAGDITQTVPATSGDKVQVIGYAIGSKTIFVDFNSTYVTVQ